jgi:sigma-E factor negative regulatory protein RseB
MKPRIFLALLLLSSASGVMAETAMQEDLDWLKTMVFAAHRMDFTGTFIYQSGSHVETSRITHVSDAAGEHERLESLDGERHEIIRNNEQVVCYLADGRVLIKKRENRGAFPALLPDQLSALNENYIIRRGENDRVAGLHAHTLVFLPRDNLRYAHKMWAHKDSGLLLKAVVLDEKGRVIEQYAFTQLTIGGDIDRKWIVQDKLRQQQAGANAPVAAVAVEASGWQVGALPAGFRKTQEMRRTLRDDKAQVMHLVFSDGLAGISVFVESMVDRPEMRQGLHSQGVIQMYSKVVGDKLLTVVGEVPPRTLLQVAESVRFKGK